MVIEIRQLIERDYNIIFTADEVKYDFKKYFLTLCWDCVSLYNYYNAIYRDFSARKIENFTRRF